MGFVFRLLKKKKKNIKNTICVLPWLHLNIIPNGKVFPCCITSYSSMDAGDINKQTIEEIWNGDYFKSLRKNMIKGKEIPLCSTCLESEKVSGYSFRTHQNNNYSNKLKEIPFITKKDGSLDKIDIKYWNISFGNLCNFKCRICGPAYSTAWIPDVRELGWISKDSSNKPNRIESINENTILNLLEKHLDTVESINFAGGEPLLMNGYWQIFEMLNNNKRYDINISINSNLNFLTYKNKNALDYWSKWGSNLSLMPSIDEIGERAELIRSGTIWKNVVENLRTVSDIGIQVKPLITVTAMNVFRIPEILDFLIEIGVIKQENENWRNFGISILKEPPMLHVSILPNEVRRNIRKKLDKYIYDYEQKYNVSIRDYFLYLFWHLEKPWHKKNCFAFKEFTKSIDKIRGENTLEVIPELSCILND